MANMDALLKKYKGIVSLASEPRPKRWFSMGPLGLNLAIGDARGVQSGKIVQVFGKPSSGKSTLSLDVIRQFQRDYPEDAFPLLVDFERAFDPSYAASIGVDLDRLYVVRPDTGEQGLNIVETAIVNEGVKLVVVDSVSAMKPASENDKDYDDNAKMASAAGLVTRFCNRMIGLIDNNDALVIMLNQMRKNFSTMSPEQEIPWGGMALQFATSVSVAMARIRTEDSRMTSQAIIKKNRAGAPQSRTEFFINYGRGIDHDADVLSLACDRGIVFKNGAWFSYGEHKAQGAEKAAREFPMTEIRQKIVLYEVGDTNG